MLFVSVCVCVYVCILCIHEAEKCSLTQHSQRKGSGAETCLSLGKMLVGCNPQVAFDPLLLIFSFCNRGGGHAVTNDNSQPTVKICYLPSKLFSPPPLLAKTIWTVFHKANPNPPQGNLVSSVISIISFFLFFFN